MSAAELEGVCPDCAGTRCERCDYTGKRTFTIPDGPAWTRRCTTCGWTNGMYFPQTGMKVPVEGAIVEGSGAVCLPCRRKGGMVWERIPDGDDTESPN